VSAAFDAVFGVFVALIVGLVAISVRWGIRRDRVVRAARRSGSLDAEEAGEKRPPAQEPK
jgi:hypothetical protein